jgi:uncharacterized protein YbcI
LASSRSQGTLVSDLSREIVQLHARLYGRGPTKARSYLHSDYAACVLEEIFTTAERTLIDAGSGDHVRDTRKKFQDAVAEDFIGIVERVSGRRVRGFASRTAVDGGAPWSVEVFRLDPEATPR